MLDDVFSLPLEGRDSHNTWLFKPETHEYGSLFSPVLRHREEAWGLIELFFITWGCTYRCLCLGKPCGKAEHKAGYQIGPENLSVINSKSQIVRGQMYSESSLPHFLSKLSSVTTPDKNM